MRTINFTKFALVIVIMATAATTTFGQRWNNANRFANNQAAFSQPTCINQITDLSDKQVKQITTLEEKHQAKMDEFRAQRRTTLDLAEKNILRAEMDKVVVAHQNEVKALLTEDQQKQYNFVFPGRYFTKGRIIRSKKVYFILEKTNGRG